MKRSSTVSRNRGNSLTPAGAFYTNNTMHMINKRLLVGNADDARNPPPQVGAVLMVAEEQNVAVPDRVLFAKIRSKEFGANGCGDFQAVNSNT